MYDHGESTFLRQSSSSGLGGTLHIDILWRVQGHGQNEEACIVVPVSVKHTTAPGAENELPNKRKKISSDIIEVDKLVLLDTSPNRWLSLKGIDLRWTKLGSHLEESSSHQFAQEILKIQFLHISGLQLTLILAKYQKLPVTSTYLQIIHSRGIVAT